MKKKTQKGCVEQRLRQGKSITSWQAIQLFGATRLSAIIYALKKEGFDITTELVPVKNKMGESATIAKYSLS